MVQEETEHFNGSQNALLIFLCVQITVVLPDACGVEFR